MGVQIKLKPGALRYTDVPGIAVTPVLGGGRDLGGQVRTHNGQTKRLKRGDR